MVAFMKRFATISTSTLCLLHLQTFSIKIGRKVLHIVSYYTEQNIERGRPRAPSSIPMFAALNVDAMRSLPQFSSRQTITSPHNNRSEVANAVPSLPTLPTYTSTGSNREGEQGGSDASNVIAPESQRAACSDEDTVTSPNADPVHAEFVQHISPQQLPDLSPPCDVYRPRMDAQILDLVYNTYPPVDMFTPSVPHPYAYPTAILPDPLFVSPAPWYPYGTYAPLEESYTTCTYMPPCDTYQGNNMGSGGGEDEEWKPTYR